MKKKTIDDLIKYFEINGYELLDTEYSNYKQKLNLKHKECGYISKISYDSFKNKNKRCDFCSKSSRCWNNDILQIKVNSITNGEYESLGFLDTNSYFKVKHKVCNNEYTIKTSDFFKEKGNRCPYCSKLKLKTHEEFEQEVYNLTHGEYTVLDKYINNTTKIKFMHEKCGKTFLKTPKKFLSGQYCTHCSSKISKGERKIEEYLNKLNIRFEKEYSFENCKFINKLKFDFIVYLNDIKFILIEFDGIQHFVDSFNHRENFEKTLIRDSIKNSYCEENNIPLYRITYKDIKNIESIIDNIVKLESSTTNK